MLAVVAEEAAVEEEAIELEMVLDMTPGTTCGTGCAMLEF